MEGESPEKKASSSSTSRAEESAGNREDTAGLKEDNKLFLLTWNVDGLDGEEQPQRARSLCSYLISYSPDVVLLQELVQPYMRFMHKRLAATYTFIVTLSGGETGCFTAVLLKKSRLTLLDTEIFAFPDIRMMRNLLIAQVLFRGQKKKCLMTSHFESCKDNAEERMRQLRLVMKRMRWAPDDVTVLFGGDTNLRDAEVGIPSSICDVWEQLGEPEKCRYTWDTRFDRVYVRWATVDGVPRLDPHSMALVGLEKLQCGATPAITGGSTAGSLLSADSKKLFPSGGGTVVWWLAPSQQEGSRFDPCLESACSPRVCVGSLASSHHPKTCMSG